MFEVKEIHLTQLKKGIILEIAVPMRSEPSDRSEMVNQLLFGEQYEVLQEEEKWLKVKTTHDSYEGWIDKKQHSEHHFELIEGHYCNAAVTLSHEKRGVLSLTPGSFLPSNDVLSSFNFKILHKEKAAENMEEVCRLFENAPYLWGGRTPLGIDCSGFTQLVFRMLGTDIPRDASEQVNLGTTITFLEEAQMGDLAFFDNKEGKITHVGIIEENSRTIIHASGRVRLDSIDQHGIFNKDINAYSHNLRTIKRIS